ncbi:MAG TPA: ABC transporter substrate-binding protein [Alphaproteobacteria bacterium]
MAKLSRRKLLKRSAVAATAAWAAGPLRGLAAPAIGKGTTLTVSVWGGVTEDSVKAFVEPEFTKQTGASIAYDIGGVGARYNKLLAQKTNPTTDVFFGGDETVISGHKAGVLMPARRKAISNHADIEPWAWRVKAGATDETVGSVPFCLIAYVLAYNPEQMKTPPTSWADMWRPEFADKLAFASVVHSQMPGFVIMAAELAGGSATNVDPGFKKLAELRPAKLTVFWTDWVSLLKSGEVTIATEFDYYLETMKVEKHPIEYVVPAEKGFANVQHVALVNGTRNQELGEVFLDLMASAPAQTAFAKETFQGPINRKVVLSEAEKAKCSCGAKVEQLRFLDAELASLVRPAWTERFNTDVLPHWRTR